MSDRFDAEKIKSILINKNLKSISEALDAIDAEKLSAKIEDSIKVRTRLGNDKNNSPFRALKDSTKKIREKNKSKLSTQTEASRSNQTFTGQMVDSIKIGIEKTKKSIKLWGGFKGYRNDDKVNSSIYRYNVRKGRDFYGLALYQEKMVRRLIRQMWLKVFKKS